VRRRFRNDPGLLGLLAAVALFVEGLLIRVIW